MCLDLKLTKLVCQCVAASDASFQYVDSTESADQVISWLHGITESALEDLSSRCVHCLGSHTVSSTIAYTAALDLHGRFKLNMSSDRDRMQRP